MSFVVYPNQHFDSLLECFEHCSISYLVNEDSFLEEEIEAMEKFDFKGIYTFFLKIPKYKRKKYEFVALKYWKTDDEIVVQLAPIRLDDEEFAKYFHDSDEFDEDQEYVNFWTYTAYNPPAYQTDKTELVDFYGHVRSIEESDTYITDNGINYQINDDGEILTRTKKYLDDLGYLKRMEKDCFMGKLVLRFAYNTGEIADDVYMVTMVDDENVYLQPISLRNYSNIPFALLTEEESDTRVVRVEAGEFYIPYDSKEDITETPTLDDIISQHKTI